MSSRVSLRLRFFAAMALVVSAIVAAFGMGLAQFVETMELELLDRTLARELQEFADRYAQQPDLPPPQAADLRAYIVRDGRTDLLPPSLRDLPPGLHDDVLMDGREHLVGRKDVGDASLYVALDIGPIETLENRLLGLSLVSAIAAFLLAALVTTVLVRLVLRPISRLSRMVSELDPDRRGVRLTEQFGDREIGQIAEAMDRYLEQLDRYIEREQAFTEDASHELRTPLATILSTVQLLSGSGEPGSQLRERLDRIERAGRQMQRQIEALLFLARQDAGAAAEDCALDELLREAVDAVREIAEQRGVTLRLSAEPVVRRVHPGMAASVAQNLLQNAINHGGPGDVEVRLDRETLTVQDRGPGLLPADLSRLFEGRYRGEQSRGLGLGLYLVKRICDRLGWRIHAESEPGRGTRFVVRFD